MKKIILAFVLPLFALSTLSAQGHGQAIGLRLTNGFGNSAEISYQHALGSANRFEADLGFGNNGFYLSGIHQWVKDLSTVTDGLNWYYGLGASAGLWNGNSGYTSGLSLGIAGQIGIEYNFNIPLQLSLDYRPVLNVIPFLTNGSYNGVALGVRYRF